MVAVPLFTSLVAVMVAPPAAWPVTSPLPLTVAIDMLLLTHVTTRPVSVLPAASLVTAESCWMPPAVMVAAAAVTATGETGTLVAVTVIAPAAAPVTRPVEETVAVAGALDVQVIARPESTVPAASFGLAASCTLAPTSTSAVAGLITTEATGTFATVTAADAFFPSLVAVIVVVPAAPPFSGPVDDTVPTDGFELDQVIARPASTVPAESCAVPVNCAVLPTSMFAALGATRTEATGTLDTVTVAVPV